MSWFDDADDDDDDVNVCVGIDIDIDVDCKDEHDGGDEESEENEIRSQRWRQRLHRLLGEEKYVVFIQASLAANRTFKLMIMWLVSNKRWSSV